MANEKKIKHLELVQAVINRMANNSFLVKGWCVTIVAAILGLASKDMNKKLIIVVYFPIFMFWLLDSYFLQQEKLFRCLFDTVRLTDEEKIDFSMSIKKYKGKKNNWVKVFFSYTMLIFYGVMAIITLIAISILLSWI